MLPYSRHPSSLRILQFVEGKRFPSLLGSPTQGAVRARCQPCAVLFLLGCWAAGHELNSCLSRAVLHLCLPLLLYWLRHPTYCSIYGGLWRCGVEAEVFPGPQMTPPKRGTVPPPANLPGNIPHRLQEGS